jgi:poly(beta-D-mannuronate) lyase
MLLLLWAPLSVALSAASTLVHTPAELAAAIRNARAGDSIVLADGVWRDVEILFMANGAENRPVTLTAQTPGHVILSGRSNLRLAGRHLLVSNLVFRDGYSPTSEVVSFRHDRERRANDSRVTGIVIDGFSKPDRLESDHWVALYGSDNRFDHNHLVGKTNAGATLVVVRDAQQGLANRHRIDHNFFGHRPNLGMNGGETIRVGTSHDSQSDSHTVVESNWFEHCDGEIEIVSNKSGANVYRGNVFFESRGALVLRHGDGNLVEDNVFFGNGKPHTGGIRVINRRQTVRNNYLEGLAGEGFASALTVMYGVPNSPLNRYLQVDGARLANNTIIDARSIIIGLGKDDERSAPPINSRLATTLIVNRDGFDPLRIEGDSSGVELARNVQSAAQPKSRDGIRNQQVALVRNVDGLLVPENLAGIGARRDLRPIKRAATGVDWYSKERVAVEFATGRDIEVRNDEGSLAAAVARSKPGDRLRLAAGDHAVDEVLTIHHPLTVQGPNNLGAVITFSRPTLFAIARGGSLKLSQVVISGANAPDTAGNAVIRTLDGSGAANYVLLIEDSRIVDLNVNRSFDVFAASRATTADRVVLARVTVERITGDVIAADAETDDLGAYNIEGLEIVDSTFRDVAGAVVNLYRGGTDESTFGPRLRLTGSTLERVGLDKTNPTHASLRLHGVQFAEVRDNRYLDSARISYIPTVGKPVLLLDEDTRHLLGLHE